MTSSKHLGLPLIIIGSVLVLLSTIAPSNLQTIGMIISLFFVGAGVVLLANQDDSVSDDKSAVKEDLTRIEGIGPKIQEILYGIEITSYAALAASTADDVTQKIKSGGFKAPFTAESWADQAKLAEAGKWDELDVLQDELIGGRKV